MCPKCGGALLNKGGQGQIDNRHFVTYKLLRCNHCARLYYEIVKRDPIEDINE